MPVTNTELVQKELRRFLRSHDAETICVTGDWGVGKTFTWQRALDEAQQEKTCAFDRYSYVSLFGLNSLDSLKLSIVENMEFLDAPPESMVQAGIKGAKSLISRAKKLRPIVSALPYVGSFLANAGPLYFTLIRSQIVCIDDIERRGDSLALKDVMGLISYLREQRKCKLILLLNTDALQGAKEEFDAYFEKVVDTRLIFSPSASEAAAIALSTDDIASSLLASNVEKLSISNIRVIKKIERLVRQIQPILVNFNPDVFRQAVHSITLFGWSKFQPKAAPPFDFLRVSQTMRYLKQQNEKSQPTPDEAKWTTLLSNYEFQYPDEFDLALLQFVDSGVLDEAVIRKSAESLDQQIRLRKQSGAYSSAWQPFHASFNDNIDDVASSIVRGLTGNSDAIGLSNLNEGIQLLRELDRVDDANQVISHFKEHKDPTFWSQRDSIFGTALDPILETISEEKEAFIAPPFVFETALIEAATSYNNELIEKLAAVPTDQYYDLIRSKTGDELAKTIFSALEYRKISNATDATREVVRHMEEALRRIGAESKLNAARIRRYGVTLNGNA